MMNAPARRGDRAGETVDVSQLGIPGEALIPGAEFALEGTGATAHIWNSEGEANLSLVQLSARETMASSLKELISEHSSWPTALIASGDRLIGHLSGAPAMQTDPAASFAGDAWLWFSALAQGVHGAGWVLGGVAKTVTFSSQGTPVTWSTMRARHYRHFENAEKYRIARDSERAEFGWLLLNALGRLEFDRSVWVPSDRVSPETARSLSLLHARLLDHAHNPPTIREWQLAFVGSGLVRSIAARREFKTEGGASKELVIVILPFNDGGQELWRERWSQVLREVNSRSPNALISALSVVRSDAPILPTKPPAADPPPMLDARPENWKKDDASDVLWARLPASRLALITAGWNVGAIRLLFPEELGIPRPRWSEDLEARWWSPVTVHDYASDGSLPATYQQAELDTPVVAEVSGSRVPSVEGSMAHPEVVAQAPPASRARPSSPTLPGGPNIGRYERAYDAMEAQPKHNRSAARWILLASALMIFAAVVVTLFLVRGA